MVGKPSSQFFHLALAALGLENLSTSQVLMIGDDIRDDVLGKDQFLRCPKTSGALSGAQEAGLVGALVQTGKYMEGDEKKGPGLPDFVYPDLLHAVQAVVAGLK